MITLHCDTCGAEIERTERYLEHTWWFWTPERQWRRGAMVGYVCPNWEAVHPMNLYAKVRVLTWAVSAEQAPDDVRAEYAVN